MGKIKNTAETVVFTVAFVQSVRGLYGLGRDWTLYIKETRKKKD